MNVNQVLDISRDLFYTALLLALPSLLASLLVGLVVSVLQTVTSIQEQTLSFVPRIVAVGLVILFTMGWALTMAVHFVQRMFGHLTEVTR